MKITLDEHGQTLADTEVESWVEGKLANGEDIHVSNVLSVHCVRSQLRLTPKDERPKVEWEFYGKPVHFDDDLRSGDAWGNPATDLSSKFLYVLLSQ